MAALIGLAGLLVAGFGQRNRTEVINLSTRPERVGLTFDPYQQHLSVLLYLSRFTIAIPDPTNTIPIIVCGAVFSPQ